MLAALSRPFAIAISPIIGLLHGNYVDDVLVIGVALYLIVMLVLARFRAKQLKRRKAKKAAKNQKALPGEEGPDPDNPVQS